MAEKADSIRVEVNIFQQYNVYMQKQLYIEQVIYLIIYLARMLLADIYSPILETR